METPQQTQTMNTTRDHFRACKLHFTVYLRWKNGDPNIRSYHLHIAKRDLELARALLNVERRNHANKMRGM